MKKFTLFCFCSLLALGTSLKAQSISNYVAFVPGDSFTTQPIDTTGQTPGPSGAGQTWNFGSVSPTGPVNVTTYTYPDSVPGFTTFPGSTVAIPGGVANFYKLSSSQLEYLGAKQPSTVGDMIYSNTEVTMVYPITSTTSNTDVFVGRQNFPGGGTHFLSRNGTVSVTADGTGTIITPAGTFSNVIRVYTIEDYIDTEHVGAVSLTPKHYHTDKYTWYREGNRGFVYQFATLTFPIAGTTTTTRIIEYKTNVTRVGISEVASNNEVSVYPNPASESMTVAITTSASEKVSLSLQNMAGQVVYQLNDLNLQSGKNIIPIEVKGFPVGQYIVNINGANINESKHLVLN
jgi:Secretion system C-terminal sorting domain